MKFILVIEDTERGIRCKAAYNSNDIADGLETSLSAKVVANFSAMLKELEEAGALFVEKE